MIFNERKLVLGLAHVMLCYVSQPEKVSNQYRRAKVGLISLILLDRHNISSNLVWYLLILSDIVKYCRISTNIVKYCNFLSNIVSNFQNLLGIVK